MWDESLVLRLHIFHRFCNIRAAVETRPSIHARTCCATHMITIHHIHCERHIRYIDEIALIGLTTLTVLWVVITRGLLVIALRRNHFKNKLWCRPIKTRALRRSTNQNSNKHSRPIIFYRDLTAIIYSRLNDIAWLYPFRQRIKIITEKITTKRQHKKIIYNKNKKIRVRVRVGVMHG